MDAVATSTLLRDMLSRAEQLEREYDILEEQLDSAASVKCSFVLDSCFTAINSSFEATLQKAQLASSTAESCISEAWKKFQDAAHIPHNDHSISAGEEPMDIDDKPSKRRKPDEAPGASFPVHPTPIRPAPKRILVFDATTASPSETDDDGFKRPFPPKRPCSPMTEDELDELLNGPRHAPSAEATDRPKDAQVVAVDNDAQAMDFEVDVVGVAANGAGHQDYCTGRTGTEDMRVGTLAQEMDFEVVGVVTIGAEATNGAEDAIQPGSGREMAEESETGRKEKEVAKLTIDANAWERREPGRRLQDATSSQILGGISATDDAIGIVSKPDRDSKGRSGDRSRSMSCPPNHRKAAPGKCGVEAGEAERNVADGLGRGQDTMDNEQMLALDLSRSKS